MSVTELVATLTEALGEPLVGERTWSWCCPRCMAGTTDVDAIIAEFEGEPLALMAMLFPYRPFTVTAAGLVYCAACRATEAQLAAAVRLRMEV